MKASHLLLAACVAAMNFTATAWADGPAKQRPLSDFLSTQGGATINTALGPAFWAWTAPPPGVKTPAPSFIGGNAAACDYAGLDNKWLVVTMGRPDLNLGTTVTGSVSERALEDGRILVQVELHTKNALTFGIRITYADFGDWVNDPLIFGARPQDVLAGATPGIGECHASFAWRQYPGALLDIGDAFAFGQPGFEFVNLSFRANATGPLSAAAGLGPTGTPGRLFISQTGMFRTTFKGATVDGFPAEYVEVRAIGR